MATTIEIPDGTRIDSIGLVGSDSLYSIHVVNERLCATYLHADGVCVALAHQPTLLDALARIAETEQARRASHHAIIGAINVDADGAPVACATQAAE